MMMMMNITTSSSSSTNINNNNIHSPSTNTNENLPNELSTQDILQLLDEDTTLLNSQDLSFTTKHACSKSNEEVTTFLKSLKVETTFVAIVTIKEMVEDNEEQQSTYTRTNLLLPKKKQRYAESCKVVQGLVRS